MKSFKYLAALMSCLGAFGLSGQTSGGPDSLRPGDVIRLRIFREPDLSGDFPLNESGNVALPRLGEIQVGDWPADSIRPRVNRAYSIFLRNPVIEVTLLRRIAIYGFVFKPGLYPVDPTMTVQEAIALAGGPSPDGQKARVELVRDNKRTVSDLRFDTSLSELKLHSGDQLFVPQLSWWARNGRFLVPSFIGAVATVTAVVVRK